MKLAIQYLVGENTLDTDAEAHLSDRNGLANSAMLASDANTLECLKAFFVAFLDPHVNAQRVAGLERGNIFFDLCFFDNIQSIHFIRRPEVNRKFQSFRVPEFQST